MKGSSKALMGCLRTSPASLSVFNQWLWDMGLGRVSDFLKMTPLKEQILYLILSLI